jgi:hypothetical protein
MGPGLPCLAERVDQTARRLRRAKLQAPRSVPRRNPNPDLRKRMEPHPADTAGTSAGFRRYLLGTLHGSSWVVSVEKGGESLMSDYRRVCAHEFWPTIDWRALLVLSSFLSLGICAGLVILLSA